MHDGSRRHAHALSRVGARHRAPAAQRHRGREHLRPIRRALLGNRSRGRGHGGSHAGSRARARYARRQAARGGPVLREDRKHQGSRAKDARRRGSALRNPAHAEQRRNHRAAHAGARHRALDGGDAADVPPRPPRRAADRRFRRAERLPPRVRSARHAEAPRAGGIRCALGALPLHRRMVPVAGGGPAQSRQTTRTGHAHAHRGGQKEEESHGQEEGREEEGPKKKTFAKKASGTAKK